MDNLGISINQIISFINVTFIGDSKEPSQSNIILLQFNLIFIHNYILVPVLVRVYTLGQSIKFNYHHLTNKLYTEKYEDDADNDIRNKFHNRSKYIVKLYLIPMLIVTGIGLALMLIPFCRSALCTDLILLFDFNDNICGDHIQEIHYLAGGIFSKLYLLIEICIFIHLLKLAFRYPIDNDKFYLKREFIFIFIIWYLTHSILYGILNIAGVIVDMIYSFYISTFRNLLLSIIYAITTYLRKDLNNDEIKSILKDFDSFMYCHVYYSFFKEYVAKNHEDDYKLLTFWIEYNIFKKEYSKFRKCNPNTSNILNRSLSKSKIDYNIAENKLLEHAENIYLTYFNSNRTSTSNNMYSISFPVDIMEKIDEIFMEKKLEVDKPEDVFDEAFEFVHNKLYNIFLHYCRNEHEYKKLENVLVFIDFYEIKRVKNTN